MARLKNILRDQRGYSMAEVLTTLAIVVILFALIAMNVVAWQANLRQKEMDSKAQTIYVTAQEQMTKIMAAGQESLLQPQENSTDPDSTTKVGRFAKDTESTTGKNTVPGDAGLNNEMEAGSIAYLKSSDKDTQGSAAYYLFGGGSLSCELDEELYNGNWVIEYDYYSLTVYSVFYSDQNAEHDCSGEYDAVNSTSNEYYDSYRNYNGRLSGSHAFVGYHNGLVSTGSSSSTVSPQVVINNGETLSATITCGAPKASDHLALDVKIIDEQGHEYRQIYTCGNADSVIAEDLPYVNRSTEGAGFTAGRSGYYYTVDLTLDSLQSDALRFTKLYGSQSNHTNASLGLSNLTEGSNLYIYVKAIGLNNAQIKSDDYTSEVFNSLYADADNESFGEIDGKKVPSAYGDTALVGKGRHLQNLDSSSNVFNTITNAKVQGSEQISIDFGLANSTDNEWLDTYRATAASASDSTLKQSYFNGNDANGLPYFKPIENSSLRSITGSDDKGNQIAGLNVDTENDVSTESVSAGLFGQNKASSLTVSHLLLTGAKVNGGTNGNAGAIIGTASNDVTIVECQSYLRKNTDYTDGDKDAYKTAFVSGKNAGGLVGESTGTLQIVKGSASTVVGDVALVTADDADATSTVNAGGLVGKATSGSLSVQQSYADSYVYGGSAAGLVGFSELQAGSATLVESYSAGFLAAATNMAGLMNGQASSASARCYAATSTLTGFSGTPASVVDTVTNGDALNLKTTSSITNEEELREYLNTNGTGSFIQGQASNSSPYNLMGQSLEYYPWPVIDGLYHYGDWVAGFEVGSLVYYEKYQHGSSANPSYGFYGANVESTLNSASNDDNSSISVVGDGYGIVYRKGQIPANTSVTIDVINFGDGAATDQVREEVIDLSTAESYEVVGVEDTYVVFPLSKDLVNTSVVNTVKYNLRAEVYSTQSGSTTSTAPAYFAFNPHFAKASVRMVNQMDYPKISADQQVEIRTARQLWNLSYYYNEYAKITSGSNSDANGIQIQFFQGRSIDYEEYEWDAYASDKVQRSGNVVTQSPIGDASNGGAAFADVYNGNYREITNVSFKGSGDYAGLFGCVSSKGKVQNVVLTAKFKKSGSNKYYVNYDVTKLGTTEKSLGVLAGKNQGSISNCAISGYYIAGSDGTLHAYANGSISIGGLVGVNEGSINKCSAETPKLALSSNYATVKAGGFVGRNASGSINNSYAVGNITVLDAKESKVSIAGFAGENKTTVNNSYCVTALTSSGSSTAYGFAPKGGVAKNSYYLNGGTYSFIGTMYPYLFDASKTSGKAITLQNLKKLANGSSADKSHSFNHLNTDEDAYPFKAVVTDADAKLVHYGDWIKQSSLGTLGVFYWEHEVNGNNNGYKMSFLGTEVDESGVSKGVKDSTLCTSHDDGGVISEYGYGYFVAKGEESNVSRTWTNIAVSDSKSNSVYNAAASLALADQMNQASASEGEALHQYTFYAYTTRPQADAEADAGSKDYICLKNGTSGNVVKDAVQNGTLTLKYAPSGLSAKEYKYAISPLFANAMQVVSVAGKTPSSSDYQVEMKDGAITDFTLEPGASQTESDGKGSQTAGNPYEVRSIDQLQYINWNGKAQSAHELISSTNYQQFNYLPYANTTSTNEVGSIGDIVDSSVQTARVNRYWTQTHDVEGVDGSTAFTPIAGTIMSSTSTSYDAVMYAWFGSTYNGQSYTIKNIDIVSDSFNVGLFGTTVGANLSNIIMYGDSANEHVVRRAVSTNNKEGAYSIGGLVGVAYDYNLGSANTIVNCAISGYVIEDKSSNKLGLGEVNIGGLVGVSNTNLTGCSAVTDIRLDQDLFGKAAAWGVFVRVGGLTGATQATVSNCYSGGSCSLSDAMQKSGSTSYKYEIYVGGIAGSGFTSNYTNFTNKTDITDGNPNVKNSYTYFEFPDATFKGGSKKLASFAITSVSDRSAYATSTVNNCYYYGRNATGKTNFTPTLHTTYGSGPVSYTYDQMASAAFVGTLNNGQGDVWDNVDIVDKNGVNIDGRFSFPSSSVLEGKNFPFPTPITQNDLTFGTFTEPYPVHVHYGDWPINGSHWAKGRDSVDIFADMDERTDSNPNPWTYKTCDLVVDDATDKAALDAAIASGNPASLFSFDEDEAGGSEYSSTSSLVDVASVESTSASGTYTVKFKVKQDGNLSVRFNNREFATFTLQITADLRVSAELVGGSDTDIFDPDTNTLKIEEGASYARTLNLIAESDASDAGVKNDLSRPITWSEPSADVTGLLQLKMSGNSTGQVTQLNVERAATGAVIVSTTGFYDYHSADGAGGKVYSNELIINVVEADVMGLSNGTSYNQALISAKGNDLIGKDNTEYSSATAPSYSLGHDANMFLYVSGTSDYLDKLAGGDASCAISKIEIDGEQYDNGEYDASKPYYVNFDDDVTSDTSGNFNYLGGLLSYNGEENKPDAPVKVTLTFADGHVLSTTLAAADVPPVKLVTITYNANGSSLVDSSAATWSKTAVANSKITLPKASEVFTAASGVNESWLNSSLDYWQLGDDTTATYKAGKSYKVTSDTDAVTFKAVWKHKLTLESMGTSYESYSMLVGTEGIGAFDDYSTTVGNGTDVDKWAFDGWYDGTDEDTAVKVLDDEGNLVATSGSSDIGYAVSNGVLSLTKDVTLHAKWHRWELTDTLEDGKRYVFAAKNTSGNDVKVITMTNGNLAGNSIKFQTSYTNVDVTSDNGEVVIADSIGDEAVWKTSVHEVPSDKQYSGTYFTLQDQSYGYYLCDANYDDQVCGIADINDCDSWDWWLSRDNVSRAYFLASDGYLRFYNRYTWGWAWETYYNKNIFVGFNKDTVARLKPNDSYSLYPYCQQDTFNPNRLTDKTLTLQNGGSGTSSTVLSTTVALQGVESISGYTKPNGSDGWSLEGWYDSRSSSATKVLNADGSFAEGTVSFAGGSVMNGVLKLTADTTLYARWKKTLTNAYEKVDTIADGDYVLGIQDSDGSYTLMQYSTKDSTVNTKTGIAGVTAYGVGNDDENTFIESVAPDSESDVLWTLKKDGSNNGYNLVYLYAKNHGNNTSSATESLYLSSNNVVMLSKTSSLSWGLVYDSYLVKWYSSKNCYYTYLDNVNWKGSSDRISYSKLTSQTNPSPAKFVFFKALSSDESTVYSWEKH